MVNSSKWGSAVITEKTNKYIEAFLIALARALKPAHQIAIKPYADAPIQQGCTVSLSLPHATFECAVQGFLEEEQHQVFMGLMRLFDQVFPGTAVNTVESLSTPQVAEVQLDCGVRIIVGYRGVLSSNEIRSLSWFTSAQQAVRAEFLYLSERANEEGYFLNIPSLKRVLSLSSVSYRADGMSEFGISGVRELLPPSIRLSVLGEVEFKVGDIGDLLAGATIAIPLPREFLSLSIISPNHSRNLPEIEITQETFAAHIRLLERGGVKPFPDTKVKNGK
jgi:hypothetical protein